MYISTTMQKDKIIFFGRLPPPSTGENIVTETVVDVLRTSHPVDIIDISLKYIKKQGFYNSASYHLKLVFILIKAYRQLYFLLKKNNYTFLYFSGSSTVRGRYIDYFLLKIARRKVRKVFCHLHNSTYKNIFSAKYNQHVSNYLVKSIDTYIFLSRNL